MKNDVQDYFNTVPDSRRAHINNLHSLIVELFPEAIVDMKYKMPTYSYAEGWVAIANQKNYVSLYTCGEIHLVDFKKKYPGFKTGKGCINFRQKDSIPENEVRAVVKHAILHPKGRYA